MAFNTVRIESLLGMITVKLQDDNFFQMELPVAICSKGLYDLFEFCNGESQCPPKYYISLDAGITKEITIAYKE